MEEQQGCSSIEPNKPEEEKQAQGPKVPGIPPATTSTAAPLSKEKIPQKEDVPLERVFTWPPTKEEDVYFTKKLYGPSDKKRLKVFEDICPS